ncbi:MAG: dicarboxylate/amino acid:cation symporter, partial [Planctomycetota bacterium]
MKFHWKVLLWMVAGVLVGFGLQAGLEAPSVTGARFEESSGEGLRFVSAKSGSPAARSKLAAGETYVEAIRHRGKTGEGDDAVREQRVLLDQPATFESLVASAANGEVLWLVSNDAPDDPVALGVTFDPDSPRAKAIAPFAFAADIFLRLLKMLIVPLVLASIVTGVASVGSASDLRRLGFKTFAYYVSTSLLAIMIGQTLVNVIRPGDGAELGLSRDAGAWEDVAEESFIDVLKRAVPENVPDALTSNGAMLQIIFFALLLGFFITRTGEPHGKRIGDLFESFFEVMMKMATGILALLPYGVFALLVKVVASTGFEPFKYLAMYMFTVALALVLHALVTLPLVLRFVGRMSPVRWMKAMSPALMTAFSTSSSSMTLPVSMKTVEERGKVSNKITSFTLPLGATINMDGTALYECIGVIFLAQYYASTGDFDLTLGKQALVVLMALLASIGAAGIPSAGLVMMLTILSALRLPVEG